MIINKITFKNYKGYGDREESITFDPDNGKLILLSGANGSGKSSVMSSFDLALFGEEVNKRGKRLSLSKVSNRRNGQTSVSVDFVSDDGNDLFIKRKISGGSLTTDLLIGGIPYTGKDRDTIIEQKIGYDYKTYKSFISMSVNNFKNFISLTPEDKRLFLDKLFNLEIINELNKVLKKLNQTNEIEFNTINREIEVYRENIDSLERSIKAAIEKNKNDKEDQIKQIKQTIEDNKEEFFELEGTKADLTERVKEYSDRAQELKQKLRDIDRDIAEIKEKIDLYKLGKCPTCHTALVGDLNLLPEFEERLEKTQAIRDKVYANKIKAEENHSSSYNSLRQTEEKFSKLERYLTGLKAQRDALKKEEDNSTEEFEKNIIKTKEKLKEKETKNIDSQKMKLVYESLLPIWGETGIKRDIIDSIIEPLNAYVNEDLAYLKLPFRVELDNNFDAHIYEFNEEIDPETTSAGEEKKINLIIMLAYIKMQRLKKQINVLFLDETFTGIDVDSIDDMLILFRKFCKERNINMFVVHHSELKEHFFDKIIRVSKVSTYSQMEQIDLQ